MKPTRLLTNLRVVIDTNVFVSAFIWGGNPEKIIKAWLKGKFVLLISPILLAEILLVLERLGMDVREIQQTRDILERHGLKVSPSKKITLCRDPKDDAVLDLCAVGKADYLITGDKDLLQIKKFKETEILQPKEFLNLYFGLGHAAKFKDS